jgi:hypothetical protein
VATRKPPVVAKYESPFLFRLVVSFPGVVGLGGDGDSADCHQLHRPGSSI